MGKRVTLLNNKGGVGKTFVAVALAEAAARKGKRVLVADMDPQANATRRLGVAREPGQTLTDCLRVGVQKSAARDYVYPHGWTQYPQWRIDVLPADLDLEDRSLEAGQPGAHYRLRQALLDFDDDYDLTIIDCPPSIKGHLTGMAVSALDGDGDCVLVPTSPEYDGMGGAHRAVEFVRLWAAMLGVPNVHVAGLITNGVRNTSLHAQRSQQLVTLIPGVEVLALVPQRARVAEVQDAGLPLVSEPDLSVITAVFDILVDTLLGEGGRS